MNHSLRRRAVRLVAAALLACCLPAAPASAQVREDIPTAAYFGHFKPYFDGSYRDALKGYSSEAKGSIKGVNGQWIDAICYYTMAGECQYQMGQHQLALEQYTNALNLWLKFNDWLVKVQFPPNVRAANSGQIHAPPWGRSTRAARIGEYPATYTMAAGKVNNNDVIQKGGLVQSPVLFPINAVEIMRVTCLAMRRRNELLGPAAPHDALQNEIVAALARRPVSPNHWSESWIDVMLGLAYSGVGDEGQAKTLFQRGLVAGGEFDHPLTPTALFELGRLALKQGELPAAAKFFDEATFSAYQFKDYMLLEEAFRFSHVVHLLGGPKQVHGGLEPAANWARVQGIANLRAALTLMAAEELLTLGKRQEAAVLLTTAKGAIGNRDMARGRAGARLGFLTAQSLYQDGKVAAGDDALAPVMAYQRGGGSLWLYHIGLVDLLYKNNKVSDRISAALFENVLREPQSADWQTDPLESLSVLMTPHLGPMEHWFEVTLARKEPELALEISDLTRRHRFHNTLAFGGRLLGLEWLLEGPADALTKNDVLQKQDLLTRYPVYSQLAQQVKKLQAELQALPLVPDDSAVQREQAAKLAKLAELSAAQAALLREIAVRREPAGLVFPPVRKTKDVRATLPEGTALLVFFATSQRLYGCLMSREQEKYALWEVGAPLAMSKQVAVLLRDMGHFEANREIPVADLKNDSWRKPAKSVLDFLLKGAKAELPGPYKEVVIVPDNLLWYVPFEALLAGDEKTAQPLLQRCRLRYAPTISLALPDARTRRRGGDTAVVTGKLFPNNDDAVAKGAFEDFSKSVKGAVALPTVLPGPAAAYNTLFERLVVYDDVPASESGPLEWAPLPRERANPGGMLSQWMQLPWGGPDQIALPGFHTPAESALKKVTLAGAGSDMFLSVCGLMASGTRTILISRWRTGGQTSYDLVREFVQELPNSTAAEAWQRSVFLTLDTPLDPEREPRLRAGPNDEIPKAAHPFFWSGYLLVDSGALPAPPDAKAAEAAEAELKK